MDLEKEVRLLAQQLAQQRDEIEVRLHLAGMEIMDLWRQSEPKWAGLLDKLGVINDDTKESSAELLHAAKVIGDELKEVYRQIHDRLGK